LRLLYRLFVWLYPKAAWLLSFYNPKAGLWVSGRKDQFRKLHAVFHKNERPVVWMHCSSLGEFEQGKPLLESIRHRYPHYFILLTFFSPSGYEVRKNDPVADHICYLPMDRPYTAQKFLNIVQPSLVLFVKYEYWFYYLTEIKERDIPLLLISGVFREDQPFFKWYGGFYRKMLECFSHLFVQNESSLSRLAQIGYAHKASISGDTRFDRVIQIANASASFELIEQFCSNYPVIIAGSTWTEDDEALDHFVNHHPDIRFIIAPHDIDQDRLKECEQLYTHTIRYSLLKEKKQVPDGVHVLIMDNMGMLSSLYRYASIAYIGGGFGDDGIHNALEAAVFNKPLVFGPVYDKYTEAIELIEREAAYSIEDALELEERLTSLLNDPALLNHSGKVAGTYVKEKSGACYKIMDYIQANRLLTN
jgi:3-deoxy-D-manno-octulosonic-acid transferase